MADLICEIRPGSCNPHMSQLLNSGLPEFFSEWTQWMMRGGTRGRDLSGVSGATLTALFLWITKGVPKESPASQCVGRNWFCDMGLSFKYSLGILMNSALSTCNTTITIWRCLKGSYNKREGASQKRPCYSPHRNPQCRFLLVNYPLAIVSPLDF